jgi:choline dehydrogenase-like flavoprotein
MLEWHRPGPARRVGRGCDPMLLKDIADLKARESTGRRTVVIGSGAVGLYAASELAKRGCKVLVVESGDVILDNFGSDSYSSVGRRHEGIRIGRSKSLGGTSNLWGGQLADFQPIDFNGREWLPGSKWPVSYDEISPYYGLTYENLGIDREAQDDEYVWSRLPRRRPQLEEGLEVFLTRWLAVPSFAVYNAQQIETSTNLLVLTNHTVVGFRASNGMITGIRVVDRTGTSHTIEGDAFILAAGTIETVRLLLHCAATTDWNCPWRDNALLGSRFQDHLGGKIATVHPENGRMFFNTFCNIVLSGHKYQPKVRLTNETLECNRILNIQGIFAFESSIKENLLYLRQFVKAALYSRKVSGVGDLFTNLRACSKYLIPIVWAYARERRIFEPKMARISFVMQGEQTPLSESRITIDRSDVGADGLPRVILDWQIASDELESIHEFALRSDRALRKAGLARLEIDEHLLNRDAYFLTKLRDTNHQAGGAIMGTSEKEGVVNRDLRVFGTKNVYVGGAATFPTIGGSNTTFTALAFATRLVDHLMSEHALR